MYVQSQQQQRRSRTTGRGECFTVGWSMKSHFLGTCGRTPSKLWSQLVLSGIFNHVKCNNFANSTYIHMYICLWLCAILREGELEDETWKASASFCLTLAETGHNIAWMVDINKHVYRHVHFSLKVAG
ncbi:uncharacterized protein LOC121404156 isoform X2 [Drosophila obscura]|uniref:uncharacterized protein LOC121404156 isoform X2 n=1 Tax=Drosophila obscura TaxID=7282 RepID=UPI001BB17A73|nr:uncharacterized protein LOC121404156 isoform X2 [Drosophila obscura]